MKALLLAALVLGSAWWNTYGPGVSPPVAQQAAPDIDYDAPDFPGLRWIPTYRLSGELVFGTSAMNSQTLKRADSKVKNNNRNLGYSAILSNTVAGSRTAQQDLVRPWGDPDRDPFPGWKYHQVLFAMDLANFCRTGGFACVDPDMYVPALDEMGISYQIQ